MTINYSFRQENDLLLVRAWGMDECLEDVLKYGSSILEYLIGRDIKRVFCDERNLKYKLNTFDTFEAAKFIASQAPKVGKIAIVCNPEGAQDGSFWETVVINRGLQACVTSDIKKAASWLDIKEIEILEQ